MATEQGPDGLQLQLSDASKGTGYLSIKKVRGLFYAKVTVEPWPAPQRTLPGEGFDEARDAAIHRARYLAAPYPLPAKREQRPRFQGKVRACLVPASSCLPRANSPHVHLCGRSGSQKRSRG